jgi:hypothetical protein
MEGWLFRIIKDTTPTLDDFTSNAKRGRVIPANLSPDLHWLWDGLSLYAESDQAIKTARRFPQLGRYLATLDLSQSTTATWERTTPSEGHYTVWGDPEELLQCVVNVVPILMARPR